MENTTMTHHTAAHRPQAMNDCIDNCTQCHAICLETINYCLSQGGKHAAADHIGLMATCADICATSAAAMLRGTAIHNAICGACAEVCRRCAQSCEMFEGDQDMSRCAEICRQCADSCAAMATV
jgi:hypothetical protein